MFSGKQKAIVGAVVALLGALGTWAVTYFPDNQNVQEWVGIILGLVTALATWYGVFQTTNQVNGIPVNGSDPNPPAA